MYCSRCGAELREGASFCSKCGAPVRERAAGNRRSGQAGAAVSGKPEMSGRKRSASQAETDTRSSGRKAAAQAGKAVGKAAVSALKKAVVRQVTASSSPGEMKISFPAGSMKGIGR